MKPSELLRMNKNLYPKIDGAPAEFNADGICGVCALGAIAIGYGITEKAILKDTGETILEIEKRSGIAEITLPHPKLGKQDESHWQIMVYRMNDHMNMTFDQIADYLEANGL